MNTQLLIQMLELSASNSDSNSITIKLLDLARQIAVDPELDDQVIMDSFSNEFYDVRSLYCIKRCFDFKVK